MNNLHYPIGAAPAGFPVTPEQRAAGIAALRSLPAELTGAVAGLNDAQLDTPYREGGWTVRTLVHHVADSHLHAYARTKLALTESEPVIKSWDVDAWAKLADSRLPVQPSLDLLSGLHARWAQLYSSFGKSDWERCFIHPDLTGSAGESLAAWAQAFQADKLGRVHLARWLGVYVWHGRHHTAHIQCLRHRRGW